MPHRTHSCWRLQNVRLLVVGWAKKGAGLSLGNCSCVWRFRPCPHSSLLSLASQVLKKREDGLKSERGRLAGMSHLNANRWSDGTTSDAPSSPACVGSCSYIPNGMQDIEFLHPFASCCTRCTLFLQKFLTAHSLRSQKIKRMTFDLEHVLWLKGREIICCSHRYLKYLQEFCSVV